MSNSGGEGGAFFFTPAPDFANKRLCRPKEIFTIPADKGVKGRLVHLKGFSSNHCRPDVWTKDPTAATKYDNYEMSLFGLQLMLWKKHSQMPFSVNFHLLSCMHDLKKKSTCRVFLGNVCVRFLTKISSITTFIKKCIYSFCFFLEINQPGPGKWV